MSSPTLGEWVGLTVGMFSVAVDGHERAAGCRLTVHTFGSPRRRLQVVKDEPDNRVLECALTGRAQGIVTGDRALLALHNFRGVRLLSLRDYLDGRIG